MYSRDQPIIERHTFSNPAGFIDSLEFVLTTIQAGLSTCRRQRRQIARDGLKAACLWGKKADGLKYGREHAARLLPEFERLRSRDATEEAVTLATSIPCLGLPKAGFLCQLMGFNVACLDVHNLRREGLPATFVKLNKKAKPATQRKHVARYVEYCQRDGSEKWWDEWCEHVAGNRHNRNLPTADAVSRFHVDAVKLEVGQ